MSAVENVFLDGQANNDRFPEKNPFEKFRLISVLAKYAADSLISSIRWWPIAYSMPIMMIVILREGSITLGDHYYVFWPKSAWVPGVLVAVFLTELLITGWEKSSVNKILFRRDKSTWSDIIVNLLSKTPIWALVSIGFTCGASLISFTWIRGIIVSSTGVSYGLADLAFLPQFIVALFIYSFLDYWTHRIQHARVVWPLHRYHHSAEEFCVLTSIRNHPFDLGSFLTAAPMILIGTSTEVYLALNTFTIYLRWLIHSRIDGDWGWFGAWVVQSPAIHRKHHILDEAQSGTNFALFSFWDRMFGTWSGSCNQQTSIGVSYPYRQGAWILPDLLRDYRDFVVNVYGKGQKTH